MAKHCVELYFSPLLLKVFQFLFLSFYNFVVLYNVLGSYTIATSYDLPTDIHSLFLK